jgi:hypothetical protein
MLSIARQVSKALNASIVVPLKEGMMHSVIIDLFFDKVSC